MITMHEKDGAMVFPILGNLLASEIITYENGFTDYFEKKNESKTVGECMMAVASRLVSRFPQIVYWDQGENLKFEFGSLSMGAIQSENRQIVETVTDFSIERRPLEPEVSKFPPETIEQIEARIGESFMAYQIFFKVPKSESREAE